MHPSLRTQSQYFPLLVVLALIVVLQSVLIDHEGTGASLSVPRVTHRSSFVYRDPDAPMTGGPGEKRRLSVGAGGSTDSRAPDTGDPDPGPATDPGPEDPGSLPGDAPDDALDAPGLAVVEGEGPESQVPVLSRAGLQRRSAAGDALPPLADGGAVPPPPPITPEMIYRVRPGDSLWKIARRYSLRVVDLRAHNELDSNLVRPGMELEIPEVVRNGVNLLPQPGDHWYYRITGGESLVDLATRLEVPLIELIRDNDVENLYSLAPGGHLRIRIPDDGPPDETSDPTKRARTSRRPMYQLPVRGRVVSKFGWRLHPVYKEMKIHTGIDIRARHGQPIRAARAGRVIFSGWSGGYGKTLEIQHPEGLITRYAHCSRLLKRRGEQVRQNDVIALVGSTGTATGPHMHFEVRRGGKPLNPMKYLSMARL